ncbi:unnamed protein product [Durusdinium trenchii]|uniref:Dynamin N-terminal domain-containing protein n=2 Tax=Durusdinium trenchii TaxID=1381693 RepID=A0ABP0PU02_9DINO
MACCSLKDPALLSAYSLLKSVQEIDPDFKDKVRVPVMVIVGMQSVGKTSLIEAILRFPVGYTDRNTGNRCPVRYIIRFSEHSRYVVGGEKLHNQAEVQRKVTEHMKSLQKRNSFSNQALTVEISDKDQLDIDITDLPGLQDKAEQDSENIRQIVEHYLKDESVIPVAVCKAEKSHETQIDFSMLEDVGLNAKHALVVINYFNKQLGDLHSVSELNSYCAGYLDKFKRVHFVMLHFEEGIDKDSMGFDERRRYDRALIPGEQKKINERIEHLQEKEPGAQVKPGVLKALGIGSALDDMQSRLSGFMEFNRTNLTVAVKEKIEALLEECKNLRESVDLDADSMWQRWDEYMLDFQTVLKGIFECKHNDIKSDLQSI